MRLIDEQRKEDSRRIVRPCSHLLCEDGEGDVEDVENVEDVEGGEDVENVEDFGW